MNPIVDTVELGFPWVGLDPFIMTVHRRIGSDFSYTDGWSMYHGDVVPGFPQHPHRGFETVTVVRRGYVDHSDSLGATARYGGGDVQWLTTGSGIQHAEMFPLLREDADNPLELFQIWLNLPPESKMVPAYFGMLWSEEIPHISPAPGVRVEVMAGEVDGHRAPAPPPDSWASRPDSQLAIWHISLEPGATWELPVAPASANRMLHMVAGDDVRIAGKSFSDGTGIRLRPERSAVLTNHGSPAAFLLLQGEPIGAPVFQMGPFVMNTPEELRQAFDDYNATGFGGWPWSRRDPVHARTEGRFALHADGRVEHREMQDAQ